MKYSKEQPSREVASVFYNLGKMAPAKSPNSKLKTLTKRRHYIMTCLIKKSQMYPHLYGKIGEKPWSDKLIDLFCDPKPCRPKAKDIAAWLKMPDITQEISQHAELTASNPPLPSPPSANYKMPRSSSEFWPWPSFSAALGLTRLPITKTEMKEEPKPEVVCVAHSPDRMSRKIVAKKTPGYQMPIDMSNCNCNVM